MLIERLALGTAPEVVFKIDCIDSRQSMSHALSDNSYTSQDSSGLGRMEKDQRPIKILPARYPRSGSFHGYADDGSGRSAKSFNTAFQPRHKLPLRALKGQCKKASAHHGLIVERCEIAESMRNEMQPRSNILLGLGFGYRRTTQSVEIID